MMAIRSLFFIFLVQLFCLNCAHREKGTLSWSTPPTTSAAPSPSSPAAPPRPSSSSTPGTQPPAPVPPASPVAPLATVIEKPVGQKEKLIYLATISNDFRPDRSYGLMILVNKDNHITAVKTKSYRSKKIKTYPIHSLKKNIPLLKAAGISLINMKLSDINPRQSIKLKIEYPYNLTYGLFHHFDALLAKRNGHWALYSQNRPFSLLHLVIKKWLGVPVGIKKIQLR